MVALGTNFYYNFLKRALDEIDQAENNLSLPELSARMGVKTAHFERLFSKWAGISPKKYQNSMMLDHSKQLLKNHNSNLIKAHELEISGAGQFLHQSVRRGSMTEATFGKLIQSQGLGYCWRDGPFGEALVMATDRGICGIAFAAENGRKNTLQDMITRWPKAQFEANCDKATHWAKSVFEFPANTPLQLIGSPFQIKVWEALMQIPTGYVTTYSDVASAIGKPNAARAVGTAIGRNPISWIIPCHRALRKSGALGGYRWGLSIKRIMLAFEAARRNAE